MVFKTLKEIQTLVYFEYRKNGYHQLWSDNFNNSPNKVFDIAELALIDTEVSEAIEEVRKKEIDKEQQLTNLGFECADIIIRTLNFMSRKGIDAEFYILAKNDINVKRDYKHGKEV